MCTRVLFFFSPREEGCLLSPGFGFGRESFNKLEVKIYDDNRK